ncbi:MAG: indole-3-glycerol phosphate synthase TrpC [Nitrospirae bacterium]|nr:indole-3-glycerol phosphate synthase TrpC [Nitrospirota bacterium]MBI3595181.1 indole-3-glycerol phosphate synthase TrpC [Nitrospirota bacterium]
MFLDEIVSRKKEDVRAKKNKKYLAELKSKLVRLQERNGRLPGHSFQEVLSQREKFPTATPLHLIAEIKKASPSKGIIREKFEPVEIAGIYENAGATAISVLTEEHFFMGSVAHLEEVRNKVELPLLRKDFLVDEIELMEAKAYGASAVLLIVALLEPNQMVEYFLQAKEIGLDVLTEVHSEKELEKILEWAPVIGINNRDLTTFDVDIGTTLRLLKYIPKDRVIVSESGLSKKEDLLPLIERGVQAVLIGETFMKETEIQTAIENLFPKKRILE